MRFYVIVLLYCSLFCYVAILLYIAHYIINLFINRIIIKIELHKILMLINGVLQIAYIWRMSNTK